MASLISEILPRGRDFSEMTDCLLFATVIQRSLYRYALGRQHESSPARSNGVLPLKTKAELPSLPEERGDGGVRSVQVALDVLEAVAFADEELGVTQIAERLRP